MLGFRDGFGVGNMAPRLVRAVYAPARSILKDQGAVCDLESLQAVQERAAEQADRELIVGKDQRAHAAHLDVARRDAVELGLGGIGGAVRGLHRAREIGLRGRMPAAAASDCRAR